MGPETLSQVLRHVKFTSDDPKLIVGLDKADDAVAYHLDENRVIIQSVDFFTPIVDEPYLFGKIAAANALSDIYAMGGKPLLAMNIVGFPSCLEKEILTEILQGGADKVAEADAILAGGHTVKDEEPKYGLAVTGFVEPKNLLTNAGAKPGDKLILTKPLGSGIATTALKSEMVGKNKIGHIFDSMETLNNKPVDLMLKAGAHACTDITGFGFLGHIWEIARASNVGIEIYADHVPVFEPVLELAAMGLVPGGAYRNKEFLEDNLEFKKKIPENLFDVLVDPQTSGGLLISLPAEKVDSLLVELKRAGVDQATVVGEVITEGAKIYLR